MALIVAFIITGAITPAIARLAVRLDVVDRPGPLKLQRQPIPYLGGVAVALGMVGPIAVVWPKALVPLGLALLLGLADDRAALSLQVRLPVEFVIGLAAVWVIPGLDPLRAIILIFGLVLMINATNLLDGLDGLASGTVAAGALGFVLISVDGPDVLALALLGSLLGFLIWNRPPASIFLGDAGSYLLGTAMALLLASMTLAEDLGTMRASGTLLFIAAPMADTIVAIVRRRRAGQPLVRGDRGHVYDQLLARGMPGPRVTQVFVAAQLLLVAVGYGITRLASLPAALATAAVITTVSAAMLLAFTNPRAAWADTSPVVDVLGTSVRLEVPADLAAELQVAVRPLETGAHAVRVLRLERDPSVAGRIDGSGDQLRLLDDGEPVLDAIHPKVGIATVVWRLNEIAATAPGYVVLHAGSVALDGRGVVLPGRSGAGKSELTAACIADGFTYFSDEQAALDLASGLLHAYGKPLGLRTGVVPASALGPAPPRDPTPPALIVFPHYDPTSTPSAARLTPALALLALCAHSHRIDVDRFLLLAALARACPAWDVVYPSSTDAMAAVHELLDGAEPATDLRPAAPCVDGPIGEALTAVELDGDVVVLHSGTGTVHHLNRSAALVWAHAGSGDRQGVVGSVLEAAPAGVLTPDDVTATVDWLSGSGLLGESAGRTGDGSVVDP